MLSLAEPLWVIVTCLGALCCDQPARFTGARRLTTLRVSEFTSGCLASAWPQELAKTSRDAPRDDCSTWPVSGDVSRMARVWPFGDDRAQTRHVERRRAELRCNRRGVPGLLPRLRPTCCQRASPARGVIAPRGLVASIVGAPFPPIDAFVVTVGWPQLPCRPLTHNQGWPFGICAFVVFHSPLNSYSCAAASAATSQAGTR